MDQALLNLVLIKYLSGGRGAKTIAKSLELPEREHEVERILLSRDFGIAVHQAKRDMTTSVLDAIRAKLHEYREAMDKLALEDGDPRVRFQAIKDLLDRGGTGAAKQISLTSPAAYKKVLSEFEENPDETTPEDLNPDASSTESA